MFLHQQADNASVTVETAQIVVLAIKLYMLDVTLNLTTIAIIIIYHVHLESLGPTWANRSSIYIRTVKSCKTVIHPHLLVSTLCNHMCIACTPTVTCLKRLVMNTCCNDPVCNINTYHTMQHVLWTQKHCQTCWHRRRPSKDHSWGRDTLSCLLQTLSMLPNYTFKQICPLLHKHNSLLTCIWHFSCSCKPLIECLYPLLQVYKVIIQILSLLLL